MRETKQTIMKKVKIALAVGLQLAMIGSIGSFVNWPYMNYVLIASGISFFLMLIFLIVALSKD